MSLAFRSGQPARAFWLAALVVAAGCAGVAPGSTTGKGGSAAVGAGGGGSSAGGAAGGSSGGVDAGADRPDDHDRRGRPTAAGARRPSPARRPTGATAA